MNIAKTPAQLGYRVTDCDLSRLDDIDRIREIRRLWAHHQVLVFPAQTLTPSDLERLASLISANYADPYIEPMPGYRYVCEIRREPQEQTVLFAGQWHSDWFSEQVPPRGTMLYAVDIPSAGGDTLFADQYRAYADLDPDLQRFVLNNQGINAAARQGYSHIFRERDQGRSMRLVYSRQAHRTVTHPLCQAVPETGRLALSLNPGYTQGIQGMRTEQAERTLKLLFEHQTATRYQYRHQWRPGDLLFWDNRSVLHCATGGYEGQRRLLYRVSVA